VFGFGTTVSGFNANGEPIENKLVGVGIAGMRERIRQFGGTLTVSRHELGTLVEATIPTTTL
jgi:signal transduction histidine kinase